MGQGPKSLHKDGDFPMLVDDTAPLAAGCVPRHGYNLIVEQGVPPTPPPLLGDGILYLSCVCLF